MYVLIESNDEEVIDTYGPFDTPKEAKDYAEKLATSMTEEFDGSRKPQRWHGAGKWSFSTFDLIFEVYSLKK